jgi:amino acid transporter
MVAGWDGLLPKWFSKLHPRFKTPVYSILFVGGITLVYTLAGQIGVGLQEAYQLVENVAGILYAFTYMSLFAIPVVAVHKLSQKPPVWLRAAAVSGFAVSVLYAVLSIFPIVDVANWHVFTMKIVGALVLAEVLGLALYVLA